MKKIIHVHQQIIRNNTKNGTQDPPIIVRDYKSVQHTGNVKLYYKDKLIAEFIYHPQQPLSCGARLWCSVYDDVEVVCES